MRVGDCGFAERAEGEGCRWGIQRWAGGEFGNGAERGDRGRRMWSGGEEECDRFTGIGNCRVGRSAVADGSWEF